MSFAALLSERIRAQSFPSQASFREYLGAHYGVTVTDSAVSAWCTGSRLPSLAHLLAILDALVVPESDRRKWMQAHAGSGRESA